MTPQLPTVQYSQLKTHTLFAITTFTFIVSHCELSDTIVLLILSLVHSETSMYKGDHGASIFLATTGKKVLYTSHSAKH